MKHTTLAAACLLATASLAQAQITDGVVKLDVLTDMSGAYSDPAGQGTVVATRMAVEDFIAAEKPAFKVETVSADHQNKPDIASAKAREWIERENVDALTELVTTSVALNVMKLAKEKNRIALISGAASTRVTNEDCNDVTVHWTYDTYALANGTASAVVKAGGKKWFFLTADYAFGHSLEQDASNVVKASGGTVVGAARHPFPGSDFSSFLLRAQASGADVIGLANAGADSINSVKQAAEFGIQKKQSLAGLLLNLTDVHALGLRNAQGMYLTEGFYWDMNDKTRDWSRRFFAQHKRMPTMIQAGQYSAVMHYLRAVKATGTDDTAKVMAQMKKTPVNDFFATNGKIREDGRMVHDMYLMKVKAPDQSKTPWDYYEVVQTIPAAQAFQPLSASRCPLVARK
ncbi:MAG: ABC transporter substrate-binding protein [Comamonadaceae bacterium]|nr:ABC transporter substrate-binding protein [Comamonadaceae bacterium]